MKTAAAVPKYPEPEFIEIVLNDAVKYAQVYSDMKPEALTAVAHAFCKAHQRAPGGLSIEVGTRKGGSAFLFAQLLALTYDEPPPLWTVDPYGSKPYIGSGQEVPLPLYTDGEHFVAMKELMARFAFHTHWKLEALEFFTRLRAAPYWKPGREELAIHGGGKTIHVPIGAKGFAKEASFILLDGEHSAKSIDEEIYEAENWLAPGGTLVVDNIDADPDTIPLLNRRWDHLFFGDDLDLSWAIGVKLGP